MDPREDTSLLARLPYSKALRHEHDRVSDS